MFAILSSFWKPNDHWVIQIHFDQIVYWRFELTIVNFLPVYSFKPRMLTDRLPILLDT
jgi:hypothetical protein